MLPLPVYLCCNSADLNDKRHKDTQRGNQDGLNKLALEQQAQQQKDDLVAARRAGGDGDGSGDGSGGQTDGDNGDDGGDGTNKNLLTEGDDDENKGNDGDDKEKKRGRAGPLAPDTVAGKVIALCEGRIRRSI